MNTMTTTVTTVELKNVTALEYLQTELYSELIAMPLWTLCAFDTGCGLDWVTDKFDTRYLLVKMLVKNHERKLQNPCTWEVEDFDDTIISAYKKCDEIVNGE